MNHDPGNSRTAVPSQLRFDLIAETEARNDGWAFIQSTPLTINLTDHDRGHISTLGLCVIDFIGGCGDYEVLVSQRAGLQKEVVPYDEVLAYQGGAIGDQEFWLSLGPDEAIELMPGLHSRLFVDSLEPLLVEFTHYEALPMGANHEKPHRNLCLDLTRMLGNSRN